MKIKMKMKMKMKMKEGYRLQAVGYSNDLDED